MSRLPVFFLLLAGFTEAALAEWSSVAKTYQSTGYADLGRIDVQGEIAAMPILIDYEKPPFDGNNLAYRSLQMIAEYNCATKQFRTVAMTSYAGRMATGQRPFHSDEPGPWQPVTATSIQATFWEIACAKRRQQP